MTSMISRLVRIELESWVHDLVVWGVPVFFVLFIGLSLTGTAVVQSKDASPAGLSGVVLLSVGLSSILLAGKLSQRNALEKRTRLFSQLPVSTREVSIASWCVRLLYLSIPTVASTVFFARAMNQPFATFALATIATYLGATTLVAAISVARSIHRLPPPVSVWANRVYIALAVVAFGIWFLGNLLVMPAPRSAATESPGLPAVIGYLMVSSVALVVADVWLRDRMDDYLG